MISSPTPDILQNLKVVLNKIMLDGVTKDKYVSALDDAITQINKTETSMVTNIFAVNVTKKDNEGVIIDVFSSEGPLIETFEFDSEDVLMDMDAGEA